MIADAKSQSLLSALQTNRQTTCHSEIKGRSPEKSRRTIALIGWSGIVFHLPGLSEEHNEVYQRNCNWSG